MVFYHHLMVGAVGGWSPPWYWSWCASGPAAVMVFFVLSGYVVGIGYRPLPAGSSAVAVRTYLGRRAVRLIPINFVAVLLACVVADAVDLPTVLGNLLFLQNFADYGGSRVLVLHGNINLWSLNYEVVFYLLFALIWWRGASLGWTLVLTSAVGLLGWFGLGVPLFVACYAFGFVFWLTGLWLAWRAGPAPEERGNWPSCVLLALITWKLQVVAEILIPLDATVPRFAGPVVKLYHLDFLPACVWLVAVVGRRSFRGLGAVKITAALIPLLGIGVRWMRQPDFLTSDTVAIVAVYALAMALWSWCPTAHIFQRCASVGLISYALYATASPIQSAIFHFGRRLPRNLWSFALCALATVAVAIGVAWYLERRLQPAINRGLGRRVPR